MPPIYPDISKKEYENRISKAQSLMKKENMDALLVTSAVNTYYFTGFDSLMLLPPEYDQLWTMIIPRDGEPVVAMGGPKIAFEQCAWPTDVRPISKPEYHDLITGIWKELKLKGKTVGAELGDSANRIWMPGKVFLDLVKQSNIVDGTSLIEELRLIKSAEELRRTREAGRINGRALEMLIPKIKVGMTERDVASLLGAHMYEEGADRVSYSMARAAERYYNILYMVLPYEKKIQKGDYVKIEYSADYRHYTSESKATVIVGAQPKASERDHYKAVAEAIKQAAKASRAGNTVADVYEAGTKALEEAGLKPRAGRQSFGHGTGIDGHEPPRIGPQEKMKLRAGMLLCLEKGGVPNKQGLYGYISSCNTTIVTAGGGERLPPLSEEIVAV